METAATNTNDIKVTRTGGASWAISASKVTEGSTLVQFYGPADDRKPGQRYIISSEPMRTGYGAYFARVTEVGGHHDGNAFGMHFSLVGE